MSNLGYLVLFLAATSTAAENGPSYPSDHIAVPFPAKRVNGTCPSEDELVEIREQLNSEVLSALVGLTERNPAPSCSGLYSNHPSGYYWVRASNGSAVRVYCDMTRTCGNVTGGWTRVGYLDMTNRSHQCPSGLRESNDTDLRTCVRDSDSRGCSSISFDSAIEYSKVCGRTIGYQCGSTNAFARYLSTLNTSNEADINSYYVDGVSFTHGIPKQHIWTLAATLDNTTLGQVAGNSYCICQNSPQEALDNHPPEFVGNDYFCDSSHIGQFDIISCNTVDPLWDGAGCEPPNTCCSLNTPPWFYKQLPQPTTDDIEMRVCRDQDSSNEDVAISFIEVFIQ